MLIDQPFVPIFDDQAEIIEANDEPLDLFSRDELNDYGNPLPAHPVEKLILNVDLILNHYGPLSIDGCFDGNGFGSPSV